MKKHLAIILSLTMAVSIVSTTFIGKQVKATDINVTTLDDQMPSTKTDGAYWYNGVKAVENPNYSKTRIVKDRTLAPRSFFIPSTNKEEALGKVLDWRANSNWQSLNGKWDFKLVAKPADVITNFHELGFTPNASDGWIKMKVPASWQLEENGIGDLPMYSNHFYPWGQHSTSPNAGLPNVESINYSELPIAAHAPTKYNPVGHYITNINVPEKDKDKKVILNFQGVESGFYVYVNGKYVGYSEDSCTMHEFDITDKVHVGDNKLAVLVYRWSDGALFENQDMVRLSGIFRDVGVIYRDKVATLDDYTNDFVVDRSKNQATLHTTFKAPAGTKILAELYDGDTVVASGETSDLERGVTLNIPNPKLWFVDTPNLYKLLFTVKDSDGNIKEYVGTEVGIREVKQMELPSGKHTYSINGERIVFKGVDRHELDGEYGRAIRYETIKKDLELMKKHNVNSIRTSHYPNSVDLYLLAQHYGIMILGEANLETHAGGAYIPGAVEEFRYPAVHRMEQMYQRDKNFTAIVAWSLGNEATYRWPAVDDHYAFKLMHDYLKQYDTKRPIIYERDNREGIVDVRSSMYNSYGGDAGALRSNDKRPYLQIEYAHSMGNSLGYYKKYWDTWRKFDNSMGGFIWDWVDQSPLMKIPERIDTKVKSAVPADKDLVIDGTVDDGALNGVYTYKDKSVGNFNGADQEFTLYMEANPAGLAWHNTLFSHGDKQYVFRIDGNGNLNFVIFNHGWKVARSSKVFKVDNQKHNFAVSYSHGDVKFFIDNTLAGTSHLDNNIDAQDSVLGIGKDPDFGRKLQGLIYKMAIFDKAVDLTTETDITKNSDGIVAYQDFTSDLVTKKKLPITGITFGENHDKYYPFGGDWNDKNNNDHHFLDNGLMAVNRTPHDSSQQLKFVQQDLVFDKFNPEAKTIELSNEFYDTDASNYKFTCQVMKDGSPVGSPIPFDVSLAPRQKATIQLPDYLGDLKPSEETAQLMLNINVTLKTAKLWADAGYEIAHAQYKLNSADKWEHMISLNDDKYTINSEETGSNLVISNDKLNFVLDELTGGLKSYSYDGVQYLTGDGMYANFYRAPVDNDREAGGAWSNNARRWAHANQNRTDVNVSVNKAEDGKSVKVTVNSTLSNGTTMEEIYTVYANGYVNYDQTANTVASEEIPSIGSMFELNSGFNKLTYFGRGPKPTYVDRFEGYPYGIYSEDINDSLMGEYVMPQETGNHVGVNWARIERADGKALMVKSKSKELEVMASRFDPYNVTASRHPYELERPDKTFFRVALKNAGLGGQNSWGARPEGYAKISGNKKYHFEYDMMPVTTNDDMSKLYKTVVSNSKIVNRVSIDGVILGNFNEDVTEYTGLTGKNLKIFLANPDYKVEVTNDEAQSTVTAVVKDGETVLKTYKFHFKPTESLTKDAIQRLEAPAETVNENRPPGSAVDGDNSTYWHTPWSGVDLPVDYVITLKEPTEVIGFNYVPRQAGGSNGKLLSFELIKKDENGTETKLKDCTVGEDVSDEQAFTFDNPVTVKTFIVRIKRAQSDSAVHYVAAAEFKLIKKNNFNVSTDIIKDTKAEMKGLKVDVTKINASDPEGETAIDAEWKTKETASKYDGYTLKIEPLEDTAENAALLEKAKSVAGADEHTKIKKLDIMLVDLAGKRITTDIPDNVVKITLKDKVLKDAMSEGKIKFIHFKHGDMNSMVDMTFMFDKQDKSIAFETNSFSPYFLLVNEEKIDETTTTSTAKVDETTTTSTAKVDETTTTTAMMESTKTNTPSTGTLQTTSRVPRTGESEAPIAIAFVLIGLAVGLVRVKKLRK